MMQPKKIYTSFYSIQDGFGTSPFLGQTYLINGLYNQYMAPLMCGGEKIKEDSIVHSA